VIAGFLVLALAAGGTQAVAVIIDKCLPVLLPIEIAQQASAQSVGERRVAEIGEEVVDSSACLGIGRVAQGLEFQVGMERIVAQAVGQAGKGLPVVSGPGRLRRPVGLPLLLQIVIGGAVIRPTNARHHA